MASDKGMHRCKECLLNRVPQLTDWNSIGGMLQKEHSFFTTSLNLCSIRISSLCVFVVEWNRGKRSG